ASAVISICGGGCWARGSSWTETSANGTWRRQGSGLTSDPPCCQRARERVPSVLQIEGQQPASILCLCA
ncbi:hypothetical protein, partial [Escherichia coli]|uniref:hypothetical protein n=1 Tax=Escherichia coli TaxID=562 RepID=UPI00200ED62E